MGIENMKEPKREVQRIEFGVAGAQARKWVAEVMPDQSIRIVEAKGSKQLRSHCYGKVSMINL